MRDIYTDGSNEDFITLCQGLDDYLNMLAGGEENRLEYVPYNTLDDIHDVIVAYDDTIPVGCGSFKRHDDDTAEIKRVFVKDEYRGQGIAKEIMSLLEQKAREKGYKKLILETGKFLTPAVSLYRSSGYTVIPNYGQYKDMPESVCMEKTL